MRDIKDARVSQVGTDRQRPAWPRKEREDTTSFESFLLCLSGGKEELQGQVKASKPKIEFLNPRGSIAYDPAQTKLFFIKCVDDSGFWINWETPNCIFIQQDSILELAQLLAFSPNLFICERRGLVLNTFLLLAFLPTLNPDRCPDTQDPRATRMDGSLDLY